MVVELYKPQAIITKYNMAKLGAFFKVSYLLINADKIDVQYLNVC